MGTLEWILVCFCSVLAASILGALISLLALLPPIRAAGRRSPVVRKTLIVLCALIALVVGFGLVTRTLAEAAYVVFSSQIDSIRDQLVEGSREQALVDRWDRERAGIVAEFWFRQVMPPQESPRCLSGRFDVCRLINDDLGLIGGPTWGFYALFIAFGLLSALATASFVWWFNLGVFS